MKATMILADYAVVADGKLTIVGGGWSRTGPGPAAQAIAIKLEVPWHEALDSHQVRLELLDADGQPVRVSTSTGLQPIFVNAELESQVNEIPPEVKPGTPIDVCLALNLGPQPLAPGCRYEWRMAIDGKTQDDWHLGFSTRPLPEAEAV